MAGGTALQHLVVVGVVLLALHAARCGAAHTDPAPSSPAAPAAAPPPLTSTHPNDVLALNALLRAVTDTPSSWADHADEPCGVPTCGSYSSAVAVECAWDHLSCRDWRVVALEYSCEVYTCVRLSGTLPPDMAVMGALEKLDLRGHYLGGTLPSMWWHMGSLKTLLLANNQLEGLLPASFNQLQNLTDLQLSYNSFMGPVPAAWGDLRTLHNLDLAFNNLGGDLPDKWGNMTALQNLSLGARSGGGGGGGRRRMAASQSCTHLPRAETNNLMGLIPDSWTGMTSLMVSWAVARGGSRAREHSSRLDRTCAPANVAFLAAVHQHARQLRRLRHRARIPTACPAPIGGAVQVGGCVPSSPASAQQRHTLATTRSAAGDPTAHTPTAPPTATAGAPRWAGPALPPTAPNFRWAFWVRAWS